MCTEAETPGGRTRTPDGDEEFQGITSGGQEMEGEYDGDRYWGTDSDREYERSMDQDPAVVTTGQGESETPHQGGAGA